MSSSGDIRAGASAVVNPAKGLFLLWAKIGRKKSDTFANRHPLPCHCIDVGTTAALLYEQVLAPALKNRLVAAFGGNADATSIGRWMAFWAACHDLGKASPGFQSKRPDAVPPLETAGFTFDCGKDHPHQFISTHVLAAQLASPSAARPKLDIELARRVGIAVGGHHGLFPTAAQWNGDVNTDVLGYGLWDEARRTLLELLAQVFSVNMVHAPENPTGPDKHWPMMVLAGLVSVADWIGSNKLLFPHVPEATDAATYAARAETQAMASLERLGWLGWSPQNSGPRPFTELFPFPPRPLQNAVVAAADAASGATLMIVEAPMGEGKTEAALYVADQCIHRLGGQGLYVAMPTMATGNQMFSRVTKFLMARYPNEVVNLQLLHSGSMLSDEFEQRQRDAEANRQSFEPEDVDDETDYRGAVVAETWFAQNKKQAILAPFGVGTVDGGG